MPYKPNDPNALAFTGALYDVGYTMREAATAWGVTYQHVLNVSRGRTRPALAVLLGFKRLTGKPLDPYLTEWQKTGTYQPKFDNGRGRVDVSG